MPFSGFEPEPSRLQAEGHIYRTSWTATEWSNLSFFFTGRTVNYTDNSSLTFSRSAMTPGAKPMDSCSPEVT
ncbi:hypothetical protein TNCV_1959721 [Trichonephila clavipes]|nr:hypothetical protein TNCV_1959721 [Trichonephila clavipes]